MRHRNDEGRIRVARARVLTRVATMVAVGALSLTATMTTAGAAPSLATVPGAPTAVDAIAQNHQASISFTAPASDGGSSIISYTVTATDITKAANGGQSQLGSTSPILVTGLTNGDSYTFTVTATNDVGTGPASSSSAAVIPANTPGSPINVAATPGNQAATVTFTPGYDGGSPATTFTVTATDLTDNARGGQTAAGPSSPITVVGLTNGDTYTFVVTPTNKVGNGPASTASQPVVLQFPVPGAPTGVSAVRGNGQAIVSFVAPSSDGGTTITSYTVTATDLTQASRGGQTTSGPSSPLTVTGLTNGDPYTFTVFATNRGGPGHPSAPSTAVVPATVPGAPTNRQVWSSYHSVALSWVAPTSNGGLPISGYQIDAGTVSGGESGIPVATVSASVHAFRMTGLSPWSTSYFEVVAVNAAGNSLPSPERSAHVWDNRLKSPATILAVGQELDSGNGLFRAVLQANGNFVVRSTTTNHALFASNTKAHPGHQLSLDQDGRLRLTQVGGAVAWTPKATAGVAASLVMKNSGALVLLSADGTVLWRGTQANRGQ